MNTTRLLSSLLLALLYAGAVHAEPDEAVLGKEGGYPVGSSRSWYSNPYRVGSWSAMDQVQGLRVRPVAAPPAARPLPDAARPSPIRYRFRNIGYPLDE